MGGAEMESVRPKGAAQEEDLGVKVAVRVRGRLQKEKCGSGHRSVIADPVNRTISLGAHQQFTFDHVFPPSCTQADVYDSCVGNLLRGCFDGYNATIIAYGQTGSGKTYTMGTANRFAEEDELGIIPRVIRDLYAHIGDNDPDDFTVRVQSLEIHNEKVKDLLASENNPIIIRENKCGQTVAAGAIQKIARNSHEMLAYLQEGCRARATGRTLLNETSNRSHAIFTIIIEHRIRAKDSGHIQEIRKAKLHLVDLAGSERIKRTGVTGHSFKETVHINKGLLALGNVVSSLAAPRGRKACIPYRDSKLTRLLKDSLGGNSRTCFICCVSEGSTDFDETCNTLKYANRAKRIRNKPVPNSNPLAHPPIDWNEIFSMQFDLLKSYLAARGVDRVEDIIMNEDGTGLRYMEAVTHLWRLVSKRFPELGKAPGATRSARVEQPEQDSRGHVRDSRGMRASRCSPRRSRAMKGNHRYPSDDEESLSSNGSSDEVGACHESVGSTDHPPPKSSIVRSVPPSVSQCGQSSEFREADGMDDDCVIFDEELLSNISETDYRGVKCMGALEVEPESALGDIREILREKFWLEEEKGRMEDSMRSMEKRLFDLQQGVEERKQLLGQLETRNMETRAQAQASQVRVDALEASLAAKEVLTDRLRLDLGRAKEDLVRALEDKERMKDQMDTLVSKLDQRMAGLEMRLDEGTTSDAKNETNKTLEALQRVLQTLSSPQADLRQELVTKSALAQHCAEQRSEIRALQRETSAHERMILKLKGQIRGHTRGKSSRGGRQTLCEQENITPQPREADFANHEGQGSSVGEIDLSSRTSTCGSHGSAKSAARRSAHQRLQAKGPTTPGSAGAARRGGNATGETEVVLDSARDQGLQDAVRRYKMNTGRSAWRKNARLNVELKRTIHEVLRAKKYKVENV